MKMIMAFLIMIMVPMWAFGNWFPVGKDGAKTAYDNKGKCEQFEAQECFDIKTKDRRWHYVEAQTVDDKSKPIYKPKYNLESCDSPSDCNEKYIAKTDCDQGDLMSIEKNQIMPGYSLFCYGITGYEQMTINALVENQALKTSIQAADAEKAQLEADISAMSKHIAFGNRIIAYIGARNLAKGLTTEQVKTVVQTYSTIQQLLASGSLLTAKVEIEAVTPDGTLITQADKDAILSELNSYLGQ